MNALQTYHSMNHWAVQGDLAAFNAVVLEHQAEAYTLALALLRDPEAADRATLQAFVAAYKDTRRRPGTSLRAWLLGLVIRACRRERSRGARSRAAAGGSAVEHALAGLPEEQQLAVLLVDRLGCSREEAGAAAGLRPSALEAQLAQGRARLAAAISRI